MKTRQSPLADLIDDPDAPPTDDELREAHALREALSDASLPHEEAELARALVLAHAPRPLAGGENEAILERAMASFYASRPRKEARIVSLAAARDRRVRRLVAAAASLVAVAACVLVFQRSAPEPVASFDTSTLVHVRSSQSLFHEPFAARGGTSARIDRITSARAGDLRENMFARWEVR